MLEPFLRQHHTDRKRMGLLRQQSSAQSKVKGHLLYCCNQVWMKNGCLNMEMPLLYAKRPRPLDGKTPHERRFGVPLDGPVIPYGAMVEYHPFSQKDISRTTSIWSYSLARCIPRLCLVCGVEAGKETLWPQTLKTWRRWTRLKSTPEGKMQREVLTPTKGEMFIFPVADGTVKISGGGQRRKTTTLIRDSPDEEQGNLRGEPDELSSPTSQQDDSTLDDAEAGNDFWPITGDFICRHHVETLSQTVRADCRIIPCSTELQ